MVARLGRVNQPHFAHETGRVCAPDEVKRVVTARWLAVALADCLENRRTVIASWVCSLCEQEHRANLLDGVIAVHAGYRVGSLLLDVALLGRSGGVQAVMVPAPVPDWLLVELTERALRVIVIRRDRPLPGMGLAEALEGAMFYGGPCATQQAAAAAGIVTDAPVVRRLLVDAVAEPPHAFAAALTRQGVWSHLLSLSEQRIWLPPVMWHRAIGGLHHAVYPTLQIVSQEWPQPDGATVALYYITAHRSQAIAVRRFDADVAVVARLDPAVFRVGRFTALDVARSLAHY